MENAAFRLGDVRIYDAALHVLANGDLTGLTANAADVAVVLYGNKLAEHLTYYTYSFDPTTSKVDENGKILLTHDKTSYNADDAEYKIQ